MTDDVTGSALDRISLADWPALEAWARYNETSIEDIAEDFEDQYRGEWPTHDEFVIDRLAWEYDIPPQIIAFVDTTRYMLFLFGDAFASIGHPDGVYIFQTKEEPDVRLPDLPIVSDEAVE